VIGLLEIIAFSRVG